MNGRSAARTFKPLQGEPATMCAAEPITVRWRAAGSFCESIGRSLQEPDFYYDDVAAGWPDGGQACLFLAVTTLPGLQPAYAVAVVDQAGRLRFKETLQFRFAVAGGEGARIARPVADTARRLERLGALLNDQIVYVPDELAADLDGLRDSLSLAWRVHSVSPVFAREARGGGDLAVRSLSDWASRGFDSADDPGARAMFLQRARDWPANGPTRVRA